MNNFPAPVSAVPRFPPIFSGKCPTPTMAGMPRLLASMTIWEQEEHLDVTTAFNLAFPISAISLGKSSLVHKMTCPAASSLLTLPPNKSDRMIT